MHLYVQPMDAIVVEVNGDGQVRLENETAFFTPSLQERRAILYAATNELAELKDLLDALDKA
jgi:hypothetical protein